MIKGADPSLCTQCKEAVPFSPAHRDKRAKGDVSRTAAQPKAGLQKPKKGVNYLAGGTSFWGGVHLSGV